MEYIFLYKLRNFIEAEVNNLENSGIFKFDIVKNPQNSSGGREIFFENSPGFLVDCLLVWYVTVNKSVVLLSYFIHLQQNMQEKINKYNVDFYEIEN